VIQNLNETKSWWIYTWEFQSD